VAVYHRHLECGGDALRAAHLERSEIDIPDAAIDFFQAHVVAGSDGRDINPVVFPTDAAVGDEVKTNG
jgi:hypothetical protein